MKKTFLIILFFLVSTSVFANIHLPFNKNYPGGIAIIKLNIQEKNPPEVYFKQHRVLIKKNNNEWYAIVGIPLEARPGQETIKIKTVNGNKLQTFKVINRIYPLKHITIKDTNKVTPSSSLLIKIKEQKIESQKILDTWTDSTSVPISFILPSEGWFSSYFGVRRIYNKVVEGRHTGLDIAQKEGEPILAAANGTVLAVKDFVLTGNTVYINHGQGLITIYAHMSSVDVHPGETVKQGEKIGEIGATGRVTGPHLHWEVALNGTKINPTLFVGHLQKMPKETPTAKK